jgi:hypothetical protein
MPKLVANLRQRGLAARQQVSCHRMPEDVRRDRFCDFGGFRGLLYHHAGFVAIHLKKGLTVRDIADGRQIRPQFRPYINLALFLAFAKNVSVSASNVRRLQMRPRKRERFRDPRARREQYPEQQGIRRIGFRSLDDGCDLIHAQRLRFEITLNLWGVDDRRQVFFDLLRQLQVFEEAPER